MTTLTITSRSQCIRTANADALMWAQQSDAETYADLVRELGGKSPDAETYADALRPFDSGFGGLSEAPSRSAGVPQRWAALYDSTIERAYRRAIRRRIAEVLASARSSSEAGAL